MTLQIGPFFWVVITILILNFLSIKAQDFIFGISTLVLRDRDIATFWSGWILLPGTFVHEFAHLIAAVFFLIPVVGFTIRPRRVPGGVILGSVTPAKSVQRSRIPIRDSLVGVAPFFVGTAVILLISFFVFQIDMTESGQILSTPEAIRIAINQISQTENPLLWIYLLFAIGNSIFPSGPDRQQWPMFGFIVLILLAVLIYFGYQQLFFQSIFAVFNNISGYLMLAFAITIVIDIVALPILWFIHMVLESALGYPQ